MREKRRNGRNKSKASVEDEIAHLAKKPTTLPPTLPNSDGEISWSVLADLSDIVVIQALLNGILDDEPPPSHYLNRAVWSVVSADVVVQ
jgi:hypothetical protein